MEQVEVISSYLQGNKDFKDFLNQISDNTGSRYMDVWLENFKQNRELFKRTGWATIALQGKEQGKTAVIMGASPAIRNQIETLKYLQHDPEFVLCAISSNLEFILENGIKPKYCMTVDGDKSQGEFFDRMDMSKTKDITLIANCYAYPPMLKKWQGPLYFLALASGDVKFEKKLRKSFGPANGLGAGFPSIVCQFNVMSAFAFLCLECPVLMFVGHELSFEADESKYYVDREDPRDKEQRFPHGDIYGKKVHTTFTLLGVKYSLEGFLETVRDAGWFFNCTEAGIFGITKRYPDRHVPWIKQLTLKNGIAQARQIMRTGEPFYTGLSDSLMLLPNNIKRVSFGNFRR